MPLNLPCVVKDKTVSKFHQSSQSYRLSPVKAVPTASLKALCPIDPVIGQDYILPAVPIDDQLVIGSCTAESARGVYRIASRKAGADFALSVLDLYHKALDVQGTPDEDHGSSLAVVLERLCSVGACDDELFPYCEENFIVDGKAVRPHVDALLDAYDHRTKPMQWAALNDSDRVNECLRAIANGCAIAWQSPVDNTIQEYQPGQVLTIPVKSKVIGGHAMAITGVRYRKGKRAWLVRNSWGTGYGEDGYLWIDDAWLQWVWADGFFVLSL